MCENKQLHVTWFLFYLHHLLNDLSPVHSPGYIMLTQMDADVQRKMSKEDSGKIIES